MSKEDIEKEIERVSNTKDEYFRQCDNYFLALLSMFFGLSASFFTQIFLMENPDLINDLFWGSLLTCLLTGGLVYLTIKKSMKKVEENYNKIGELLREYLKEWNKERKTKRQ